MKSPSIKAIHAAGTRMNERWGRLDYPPLSTSAQLVIEGRRRILEGPTYRLVRGKNGAWQAVTEDEYHSSLLWLSELRAKQPPKRTLGEMLRTSELLLLTEGTTRH
jgi:hypothetical protein